MSINRKILITICSISVLIGIFISVKFLPAVQTGGKGTDNENLIVDAPFRHCDDTSGISRFTQENMNDGIGAGAGVTVKNNVSKTLTLAIASSNFNQVPGEDVKNSGILILQSDNDMHFVNTMDQAYNWWSNPSDTGEMEDIEKIMTLSSDGNIKPKNYLSADGSVGITQSFNIIVVGGGNCDIEFKNGLLVDTDC